jgi:hypothetical protein
MLEARIADVVHSPYPYPSFFKGLLKLGAMEYVRERELPF